MNQSTFWLLVRLMKKIARMIKQNKYKNKNKRWK